MCQVIIRCSDARCHDLFAGQISLHVQRKKSKKGGLKVAPATSHPEIARFR